MKYLWWEKFRQICVHHSLPDRGFIIDRSVTEVARPGPILWLLGDIAWETLSPPYLAFDLIHLLWESCLVLSGQRGTRTCWHISGTMTRPIRKAYSVVKTSCCQLPCLLWLLAKIMLWLSECLSTLFLFNWPSSFDQLENYSVWLDGINWKWINVEPCQGGSRFFNGNFRCETLALAWL